MAKNILEDDIGKKILRVLAKADAPLETKDIHKKVSLVSGGAVLYRLKEMRYSHKVEGVRVGPSRGGWIWWRKGLFEK